MNFKEALARDVTAVFLNVEEFGERMVIDGVETPAMWGQESRPAPDEHERTIEAWGVNTESAVLLVPVSVLPLPVPGQRLSVDARIWTVVGAEPLHGLIRLELQRNTA